MPTRRRLLMLAVIVAVCVPAGVARADDCGIEGTYFSGRSALTNAGTSAALGTFVVGSEASPAEIRAFTFGRTGAPTSKRLSPPDADLSTPVFVRGPDGTTQAIVGMPNGIVALSKDTNRVLVPAVPAVPAVTYGAFGAATAADGTLTLAYEVGKTVRLARFDANGQSVATLDVLAKTGTPTLATVAPDGTTLILVSGVATAYRWTPGATTLQTVALPDAPSAPADDDALQPDLHGGAWIRLGTKVLHISTDSSNYVPDMEAFTTLQVDAAGRAVSGHGARVAVVDPSGAVVSDGKVGSGVNVEAVAPSATATATGRPTVLVSQTRRKRRTLTLIRPDRSRATVVAKARNFTTDAQLATLPGGTTWAVWQDGHAFYDQNCNLDSVEDQSIQAARVTPHAKRATAKTLAHAPVTVESS